MSTYYRKLSTERKALQINGDCPEWFSTAGYQMFKERYLFEAKTPREQMERIAHTAAMHAPSGHREKAERKFFELIWNGWLSCSTPVLANTGTNRGLPVSCSGSVIEDSIDGFYSAAREAALLTKHGFGTSSYLGNIRARGSAISSGGRASGVVPIFKHFINIMRDVSQSGIRRGSWAGYLPIEHGDFDELADYVKDSPDDANVGWNISDDFIEKLKAQDPEALRRYQKAMKLKMLTGKGYFCFIDEMNKQSPHAYKKHGLTVKASNLCFTGDTLVAVGDRRIAVSIACLANESKGETTFPVFCAESKSSSCNNPGWAEPVLKSAVAFQSGHKKVIKLVLSDGSSFECTDDHKIALPNGIYALAKDMLDKTTYPFLAYTSTDCSDADKAGLRVVDIVDEGRECPVYDLSVADNHNFFILPKTNDDTYDDCPGVLVHNCSEVALHADENHTFTCILSSMNLAKYDEWKDTDAVFWSTVFLDCICSEFLSKARKIDGLEKAVRATEKGRAIGLGAMGLHTLFQKRGIPFEDIRAFILNTEVFKHLHSESKEASIWLAKELGEPEWCEGLGIRNTHNLAVAPNKCGKFDTKIKTPGGLITIEDLLKEGMR